MTKPRGRPRTSDTSFLGATRHRASPSWLRTAVSHNRPRLDELARPQMFLRGAGLHLKLRHEGYTMLSSRRARNLYRLAAEVASRGVEGAVVDCGVWNGGSSILLSRAAPDRQIYALDSFEGLPEPSEKDGPDSDGWCGAYVGSAAKVEEGFTRFADPARLRLVTGWFQDTIPTLLAVVDRVALLHVDADWYESVKLVLEGLYPRLGAEGIVAIDDYSSWAGARLAVDEFRTAHGIVAPLVDGHWWRV